MIALKNRLFTSNEILERLATSLVIGLFLEAGTLKGARVASVLRIEDWQPVRLVIFAGIAFMLITLYEWAKSNDYVRGLSKIVFDTYASIRGNWRILLVSSFAAVIGSILLILISRAIYGSIDSRIVLIIFFGLFMVLLILNNWTYLNESIYSWR